MQSTAHRNLPAVLLAKAKRKIQQYISLLSPGDLYLLYLDLMDIFGGQVGARGG
jgi:hypothetical protein